jgi:hypothetical protein
VTAIRPLERVRWASALVLEGKGETEDRARKGNETPEEREREREAGDVAEDRSSVGPTALLEVVIRPLLGLGALGISSSAGRRRPKVVSKGRNQNEDVAQEVGLRYSSRGQVGHDLDADGGLKGSFRGGVGALGLFTLSFGTLYLEWSDGWG